MGENVRRVAIFILTIEVPDVLIRFHLSVCKSTTGNLLSAIAITDYDTHSKASNSNLININVPADGLVSSGARTSAILCGCRAYDEPTHVILRAVLLKKVHVGLSCYSQLTHWGWVTHICVGKLTIIGSDNGLSSGRRQAIIWTNGGILLIRPLGTNFSEIRSEIHTFSFKKMHLKMSSGK